MTIDLTTKDFVRERAKSRCEYCSMPQWATPVLPFHTDHIVAQPHRIGANHESKN
jgi:hypothetical protein